MVEVAKNELAHGMFTAKMHTNSTTGKTSLELLSNKVFDRENLVEATYFKQKLTYPIAIQVDSIYI